MDLSNLNPRASVYILVPLTKRAEAWLVQKIDPDAQRFGGGVAIENRYLGAILDGIEDADLMAHFEVRS